VLGSGSLGALPSPALLIMLSTCPPAAGTQGCAAESSSHLAVAPETMLKFLVSLMKRVNSEQSPLEEEQLLQSPELLLLPNFFAWCCSDVTLVLLERSRKGGEEINCSKHQGKHRFSPHLPAPPPPAMTRNCNDTRYRSWQE